MAIALDGIHVAGNGFPAFLWSFLHTQAGFTAGPINFIIGHHPLPALQLVRPLQAEPFGQTEMAELSVGPIPDKSGDLIRREDMVGEHARDRLLGHIRYLGGGGVLHDRDAAAVFDVLQPFRPIRIAAG